MSISRFCSASIAISRATHEVREVARGVAVGAEVVGVHTQIIRGHIFPNLSDIFDKLTALLEGRRFVVVGDRNSCRLIDRDERR